MPVVDVEVTKLVGADPEKVFKILVEPEHHRRILPDEFSSFTVDSEGIFHVEIKSGMIKKKLSLLPEVVTPNVLFRETDLETSVVTEFKVKSHPDGSLVSIHTRYSKQGLAGFIESFFAPDFLKQLYEAELTKLCRYALLDIA